MYEPTENVFRPFQSYTQYGFTAGMSYLLGAVLRTECEAWAIDNKETLFMVTCDGDSAFDVTDRDIQVRELYENGEDGDTWLYSRALYKNTECAIKMEEKMSRTFEEQLGSRQGHKKSSGHYKQYNNPIQMELNESDLGAKIGNYNISNIAVADDLLGVSNNPNNLQIILNKIASYGRKYRVEFSAKKMKITVIGSKVDQKYWKDTSPWSMNNINIEVVEDNEHLGQIISGVNPVQKNIDLNIDKTRKCLFSLMGHPFSHQSQVNPSIQHSTWTIYVCPVLRSGLSSLVIQPQSAPMKSLEIFQRKILRGMLGFSSRSPIPGLQFLLGELPIVGQIHRDCLSLFWSIWSNPNTLAHKVVKYLLIHAPDNSRTWSNYIRHITRLYGLPDPIQLLQNSPPTKVSWKGTCDTLIYSHYERKLRDSAATNSGMARLNVALQSLHSPHPMIKNVTNPREVQKLKTQLKVLSGDFYTNSVIGERAQTSQKCHLCGHFEDDIHVFSPGGCPELKEPKTRIFNEMKEITASFDPPIDICSLDGNTFTQFLCDPSSFNLPPKHRVNLNNNEEFDKIYKCTRDYIFAVVRLRGKKIEEVFKRKETQQHNN